MLNHYLPKKFWLVAIGLLILSEGCNSQAKQREGRTRLSGIVTYKGKLIPGGTISVISKQDPMLGNAGIIGPDGTFVVNDTPIGLIGITIDTKGMLIGDPKRYVEIPLSYADPEKSSLTYEVKPGENSDVKLDLK